jgi:hypothetical protein
MAERLRPVHSARSIVLVGAVWIALAFLKLASPPVSLSRIARELGVSRATIATAYYLISVIELCVGIGLLWPRFRLVFSKLSFLLAGCLGVGYILLEPLRSHCPCTGGWIQLPAPVRVVLTGSIVLVSFWYMWSNTPPTLKRRPNADGGVQAPPRRAGLLGPLRRIELRRHS